MKDIPEVNITNTSSPIVAKVKKLSSDWKFKISDDYLIGDATGFYYYEQRLMKDGVTRYYAREMNNKLKKDERVKRMKWIKRKFLGPKSNKIILREGADFYDVIDNTYLKKICDEMI